MRRHPFIVGAIAAGLTVAGCSSSIPQSPQTSFEPTPAIAATQLADLFLNGDEVRSATGVDANGDPIVEGMPQTRGGDRTYPCAPMVAGPRDAAVIGGGYLAYRTVESSNAIKPRITQTIALYPQDAIAIDVFKRITTKLNECRATPDTGGIIGPMEASATQVQWSYSMAGGSGVCGIDIRRVDNVILGTEVCGTGQDAVGASNVADRIVSKIRAS